MLSDRIQDFEIVEEFKKNNLYPYFKTISSEQDTQVLVNGKKALMFGSNSYLGLTNHPRLKAASKNAIDTYGSGCAGSRFLNGTLDLHLKLEDALADFVGKEAALVFSTGYQTNLGVIAGLTTKDDYLISDDANHASIIDGTRLSAAKTLRYRHNNLESLEEVLKPLPKAALKLIVVDGVFSMEGDLAKLDGIVTLAKRYNAHVIVDDAHGLGVMGNNGRGTCDHFNVTKDVDVIIGTFSKSLASIGGFVAADQKIIDFLKHHARSIIFSASIAPANAASALEALQLIKEQPKLVDNLWNNTNYAMQLLKDNGFDIGQTQTPIIPIYIRDYYKTFLMTKRLLELGIFVNPIVAPAVKPEESLIRFTVMANHTKGQIDEAVTKLIEAEKFADANGLFS